MWVMKRNKFTIEVVHRVVTGGYWVEVSDRSDIGVLYRTLIHGSKGGAINNARCWVFDHFPGVMEIGVGLERVVV